MVRKSVRELEIMACRVRRSILDATHAAGSGHPGGSLGAAEIFTTLYFDEMNIDPRTPAAADRDRFVLSKGHTAPGLYAALAHRGFFPVSSLTTLRKAGSFLQGHPSMNLTPGVDMSTGSLGQGVSAACGMAIAAKKQGNPYRVYTLLGDGELEEGECWEAFLFAAHYKLDNLCVVIDLNGLQIDGATRDVMNTAPVNEKMQAFGFAVVEVDGHDIVGLQSSFLEARRTPNRPTAVLARTTKGRGVSFMENKAGWHGKAPNDTEYAMACAELAARMEALGGSANE